MHKFVLAFLMLSFISLQTIAQNQTDSIYAYQALGTVYAQNGKKLNVQKIMMITNSNPAASSLMKKAQSNNIIGSIIGGVGGFLVGWQLGAMIGGGEPNLAVGGIGAGLVAVSIPFSIKFGKQTKEAVRIYNESLQGSTYNTEQHFRLFAKPTSIGIAYAF